MRIHVLRQVSVLGPMCFCLVLSSRGYAQAPAPAAKGSGGPDRSSFDIPILTVRKSGFGTVLEDACKAFKSGKVVLNDGKPVAAVPRNQITDGLRAKSDSAGLKSLAGTATKLGEICAAIEANTLDDSGLDDLRVFQDSGALPSLARAMAALGGATVKAGDLADAVTAAHGQMAGSIGPPASLSGLESNLFNGLADFLVTRSKEEAILYIRDQFAEEFCKANVLILFPNTCATIQELDASLSISAIGTALNAAAKRDLILLPDGLLKVSSDLDQSNFYAYESLRLVYAVALAVHEGRLPQEVILSLHALPLRNCEKVASPDLPNKRCQEAFSAFRFTSALLYSGASNSLSQIESFVDHRVRVVGTLLEAEYRYNATFVAGGVGQGSPRRIQFAANDVDTLGQVLVDLHDVLGQWNQNQTALTSAPSGNTTTTDRRHLLGTVLFETLVKTGQLVRQLAPMVIHDPTVRDKVVATLALVRDAAVLGQDVINENIGALPMDANGLIGGLGLISLPAMAKSALKDASKLVPIVSEIAAAKSSADVSAALEAAAAPADSYRAKYQRPKIGLNALVGGLFADESLSKPTNAALGEMKSSAVLAGFAPVGVEASLPLGSYFYLGGMLSVIDIGALTTARLKTEVSTAPNVSSTTNVTFAQVFSPGAYVLLGIAKSPLVFGGGASFAPSLRTLEATDANGSVTATEKVSALRIGIFLAMDVSLLSL